MLTPGIRKNFTANTAARAKQAGGKIIAEGKAAAACGAAPVWFETGAAEFLKNRGLSEEIFGPSSLVVWCRDRAEMLDSRPHVSLPVACVVDGEKGRGSEGERLRIGKLQFVLHLGRLCWLEPSTLQEEAAEFQASEQLALHTHPAWPPD